MNRELKPKEKECLNCKKELKTHQYKYCSNQCQQEYRWLQIKQKIETIKKFPYSKGKKTFNETRRPIVRKYLIETEGNICKICKNDSWRGKYIPLIVDHIDGNSENHNISNFRMICPNCDAQNDTYKNKNISNRKWRKDFLLANQQKTTRG